MKINAKEEQGITLVTLIIMIVLLLIISSIAYSTGSNVIQNSRLTVFTTELEVMQTEVDSLYKDYKNGDSTVLEIGQNLQNTEQENIAFAGAGITDKTGYKYYNKATLEELGIEAVDQELLVNIETKSVISLKGVQDGDQIYYTIEQVPNSKYIVK